MYEQFNFFLREMKMFVNEKKRIIFVEKFVFYASNNYY